MLDAAQITFDRQGLVPCVIQDWRTGEVLTLAYMNELALQRTLETGELHLWSRSRGELWHKGATSGNTQAVRALRLDCDGDAVLALVEQIGAACHNGTRSCFVVDDGPESWSPEPSSNGSSDVLGRLDATIAARADAGSSITRSSYTARLLADRNLRLKKLGEETAELVTACADGNRERAAEEAADLIYHTLVALRAMGASLEDVERVLARRAGGRP
jgi:phosphoribosyl-ATP pyrophosphohydrolase/phosphoribosyl-AMP cyclohydrolase